MIDSFLIFEDTYTLFQRVFFYAGMSFANYLTGLIGERDSVQRQWFRELSKNSAFNDLRC